MSFEIMYNIASDDSKLGLFILFNIKINWSVATTVPLLEAYKIQAYVT